MSAHFNALTGQFLLSEQLISAGKNQFYDLQNGSIVFGDLLVPKLGNTLFDGATLDLKFADDKSLTDRISGNNLVTFTRASSATYVDGDGVIKTTPVNLLLRSEELDNAVWTLNGSGTGSAPVVTANYGTAPDGTNTADRVQFDKGVGSTLNDFSVFANNTFNSVVGQPLTQSVYIRTLDGSSKTISFSFSGLGERAIVVTGDWQRFVITLNSATDTGRRFRLSLRGTLGTSDTADVLIWGAQAEISTTATDYIPTTSTISGAPRFDHDPATGESLGLLIEEARTNLVTQSSDLSNAAHIAQNLVAGTFVSSTDSPVQGELSYRVRPITKGSAAASSLSINSNARWSNGSGRKYSVFVKNNGGSKVCLDYANNLATDAVYFEFATETFKKYDDNSVVTSGVGFEKFANGWYRLFISSFTNSDTGYITVGSAYWYANTEGDIDVLVCAPQAEAGSFITSYIPTAGASVTRAADVAEITGTNFSSWYNQSGGTVFAQYQSKLTVGGATVYDIATDNANRITSIVNTNGSNIGFINNSGTASVSISANNNFVADQFYNLSFAFSGDNAAVFLDGVQQGATDTSVVLPTVSKLNVGNKDGAINRNLNGHIKRLAYFPVRKTDEELQELTR